MNFRYRPGCSDRDGNGTWRQIVGNSAILRTFWENVPCFWPRLEDKVSRTENWGWLKEIWSKRMENRGFRIQNRGWRVVDWGQAIKIWGIDFKAPNFPLEDILHLFPGLFQNPMQKVQLKTSGDWAVTSWTQLTSFPLLGASFPLAGS